MKVKDIMDYIKAKTIYFQDLKENYITDTSNDMCYLYALPDDMIEKIEPFNDADILITLQKNCQPMSY